MPYWLHDRKLEHEHLLILVDRFNSNYSGPVTDIAPYATNAEARTYMLLSHKITFLATNEETYQWHSREERRFTNGTYSHVPWYEFYHPSTNGHYAHLSLKKDGTIAYTKNDEHGVNDRQTIMRPGKYLQEYFSDVDNETRVQWIAECSLEYLTLKIATDADTIETVYLNGPSSCMSHPIGDYDSSQSPVRAYGNSDLALAYYGSTHHASARCIVWPKKMKYSRIYGNESVLRPLLETAGYTRGTMFGARIRAIETDTANQYLMPYIDGIETASFDGTYFHLDNGGGYTCKTQSGVVMIESEIDYSTCEHCRNEYDAQEEGTDTYCQSCEDDRSTCEHCDESYWTPERDSIYCETCRDRVNYCVQCDEDTFDDVTELFNGDYICESCATDLTRTCPQCDRTWIEETLDPEYAADRLARHISHLCPSLGRRHYGCDHDFQHCMHCDRDFVSGHDRCTFCNMAVRCELTADLLADNSATPEVTA
jgi:hypothetical protein